MSHSHQGFDSREEQGFESREEWLEQRQQKLTASNLGALLLATSDEEWQKAKARFHGEKDTDIHETQKMAHGLKHEKDGVYEYQKTTRRSVRNRSVDGEWESEKDGLKIYLLKTVGGIEVQATPDGIVGERGLLEVKCPYNRPPRNKIPLRDYIQMNTLRGTDRKWCDYVSWTQDGTKSTACTGIRTCSQSCQRYKQILTALTENTASPPFEPLGFAKSELWCKARDPHAQLLRRRHTNRTSGYECSRPSPSNPAVEKKGSQ